MTPPSPWATRSTTLTSANRSPRQRHTRCVPSALYSENHDSSVKRHLSKVPDAIECEHFPSQFGYDNECGRRACRWASLRRCLTVCAEFLWLCKPIVAAAVRVAGLRRSWRWRCWMWRSWGGVVTCGLRSWGRLDVLTNSLKRIGRRLMVAKWTFNLHLHLHLCI